MVELAAALAHQQQGLANGADGDNGLVASCPLPTEPARTGRPVVGVPDARAKVFRS
jgi:hypothetical protein